MVILAVDGPLPLPCPLSPVERETLYLMAQGHTKESAARYLGRSESTIKTRVSRVFEKLDAKNVAHAVHIATKNRWI